MCRIAAFPPQFPRNKALEILENFEGNNTDGTGSAYLKNGRFILEKWAKPFSKIVRKNRFLGHMPYNDGWTIVHLRAASHGKNTMENTHPFVVGPWAFIHNGIWPEYRIVKLALSTQASFRGETDSEVAANLWNIVGPEKFSDGIEFGGVFMGLNLDGKLWVVKTSGDLKIKALRDEQILLASELEYGRYENTVEAYKGWYLFDKNGRYVKHKQNIPRWERPDYVSPYGGQSECQHISCD